MYPLDEFGIGNITLSVFWSDLLEKNLGGIEVARMPISRQLFLILSSLSKI
jgi:hypothetical protein